MTLEFRQLRAQKELKGLSLSAVSKLSKVPYNTCSMILRGRLNDPKNLERIRQAIKRAPTPK